MIISVTINGVINYIDTDMILYAYDNSGLTLVVASNTVTQNPNLELFVSASPQSATLPTYSDFKTATAAANFLECTHATYTNIYVNLKRIQRLESIDSSNTTILFDKYNTVDTSTGLGSLLTSINTGIAAVVSHNSTTGLQGGTAGQYYHMTSAQATVLGNTSGTNSGNETAATIGAIVHGATNYATPLDADKIGIWDVANNLFKSLTWANVKATLKTYFDTLYATISNLNLKAPLASPTFTGTPILSTAKATSLNTGTTLDGVVFAKSTTAVTLASTAHAETIGNEATGVNMALGLYSTGVGIQGRNNGAVAALNINPLGGDVRFGLNAPAGVMQIIGTHTGTGTGDYCTFELRNGGGAVADAMFMRIIGTAATLTGINQQDYGVIGTGTNISGLAIGTQASAPVEIWTNNTKRWTINGSGNLSATGQLVSTGGGVGYAVGAGGTATQGTSRSTAVTLNKLCGTITMFSAAQAADAIVTFTLTNSFIESTDFIQVQHISATNGGAWNISVVAGTGSATITIRNVSNGSITEATPLRFIIFKATTS